MRRTFAGIVCAAAVVAPAAIAQETTPTTPVPPPEPTIAQGVSVGGVDLSGLTQAQAEEKLTAELEPRLMEDMVVGAAGRPFTLTMKQAKLKFDAHFTAAHALEAQPAPPPAGGGAAPGTEVPPVMRHSRLAVRSFVDGVARAAYRAPRNAKLTITLRHMRVRHSKDGKRLDAKRVAKLVDRALDDVTAPRRLHTRL